MNTKEILWKNVRALMVARYGEENLNKTASESKALGLAISIGSLARIKAQETAIGLDVLEKLAGFFGVLTYQLLVEDFDSKILDKIKLERSIQLKQNESLEGIKDLEAIRKLLNDDVAPNQLKQIKKILGGNA